MARPVEAYDVSLGAEARQIWRAALDYYAVNFATRDLRTGEAVPAIRDARAASRAELDESVAINAEHRAHLLAAAEVYRRRF